MSFTFLWAQKSLPRFGSDNSQTCCPYFCTPSHAPLLVSTFRPSPIKLSHKSAYFFMEQLEKSCIKMEK